MKKSIINIILFTIFLIMYYGCGKDNNEGDISQKDVQKLIESKPLKVYNFGDIIFFGEKGTAISYFIKGWSKPENNFTWTEGKEAKLSIPYEKLPQSENLTLKFNHSTFLVPGKLEKQNVIIFIDSTEISNLIIDNSNKTGIKEIVFSSNIIKNPNYINIIFKLPDAQSPINFGTGGDLRVLGINISTLIISSK